MSFQERDRRFLEQNRHLLQPDELERYAHLAGDTATLNAIARTEDANETALDVARDESHDEGYSEGLSDGTASARDFAKERIDDLNAKLAESQQMVAALTADRDELRQQLEDALRPTDTRQQEFAL